ncbi:MAG: hypothetical protein ACLSE8_02955 [Parasutterella sp.]
MSDCCTDACCCGKVIDAPVVTPVIGSKRVEPGKYKGICGESLLLADY